MSSRLRPNSAISLSLLLAFLLSSPAGAISFGFSKVVATGDPATGLPALTEFDQFSAVSLNDNGDIVFSTFVSGFSIGPENDQLIYRAPFGAALTPLVRQGDPAPGAGAGVLYGIPGPAVQNDSGQFAFSPHLNDGGSDEGAVYLPGETLFAREGAPAPGAGGATWNEFTHLITPTINSAGAVAFQANLSGTPFGSSIWGPDAGGAPTLVAQEGEAAPGFAAGVEHDNLIFSPELNDSGQMAFSGELGGTGGGESVLWVRNGASDPGALVRGSGTQPALQPVESYGTLSVLDLSDAGDLAFHSFVEGVGVDADNDGALWRTNGSSDPTLVAREGDSAPGAPANFVFSDVRSGAVAENGAVAFAAETRDGSLFGTQTGEAIYRFDGIGQLDLVLQTGDAAPGPLAGIDINGLAFDPLIDDEGNFTFIAELSGTGIDSSNDRAVFYYDVIADEVVFVIREGDSLEVAPGDSRTIGTLFSPDLNNSDQLSLFVSFVGGGQGIFLTAIPEPGTGLLVALGCVSLAARRRASRRSRA